MKSSSGYEGRNGRQSDTRRTAKRRADLDVLADKKAADKISRGEPLAEPKRKYKTRTKRSR